MGSHRSWVQSTAIVLRERPKTKVVSLYVNTENFAVEGWMIVRDGKRALE